MASDFVKLVSQANPASRQYGAPGESYDPPSHSYSRPRGGPANEPQLLDPFFDDDDEDVSGGLTATGHSGGGGGGYSGGFGGGFGGGQDMAFGRPEPMQSVESGFPLTKAAVNPAGHSKITLPGTGQPQGWIFDEDEPVNLPSSSKDAANSKGESFGTKLKGIRKGWKWPWEKEKVLTGERLIGLNDYAGATNGDFKGNAVSTSKYNLATFVPKFLYGSSSS